MLYWGHGIRRCCRRHTDSEFIKTSFYFTQIIFRIYNKLKYRRILIMSVCQLVYKYLVYFYIGKLLLVINMSSASVIDARWLAGCLTSRVRRLLIRREALTSRGLGDWYCAVIGRDVPGPANTRRWLVELITQPVLVLGDYIFTHGRLHWTTAMTRRISWEETIYLHTYEYFYELYMHTSVYKAVIEPLVIFRMLPRCASTCISLANVTCHPPNISI